MAIEGALEIPAPQRTIERTRRVVIDCPYTPGSTPVAYSGRIDREKRLVDADGNDVAPPTDAVPYTFNFSDVQDEVISVDGKPSMTVADLAVYIEKYCDQKVKSLRGAA